MWGQKATQLTDYASRGWGGLTKSFYRERWKRFTTAVLAAMEVNQDFDAKAFYKQITQFEYEWTSQKQNFRQMSGESSVDVAKELQHKYEEYFK